MNNLIAESIKKLEKIWIDNEGFQGEDLPLAYDPIVALFKQELQAIAEKTREETLWEVSTEVHKMANKYGEGYMAAVVNVKSILARLNTDKEK